MRNPPEKHSPKWWQLLLVIPLLPVVLLLMTIALVCFVAATISLHVVIWTWWCLRGRDILLVYSDSPVWHDYIEQRILPQLGSRTVVLNWSQRKRWRVSVARLAFHHFAGYRHFNPLAVVFRPFHRSRTFRFWLAFQDFKHGHPAALHQMETELFTFAGVSHSPPTS